MSSIILRTEKLCKTFSNGGLQQHVLKNMDIDIMQGDFTVIMGASGSGKSTLCQEWIGLLWEKCILEMKKYLNIRMINWRYLEGRIVDLYFKMFIY